MKYRLASLFFAVMILQGCTVSSNDVNLTTGVQYIGGDTNIISKLDNLKINYRNASNINLKVTNEKIIIIEPYHIKDISKEDLEAALDKGFYVFFINMVNDKELQKKFFNQHSYEMTKDKSTWTQQLYYGNEGLTSKHISIKGTFKDNIKNWLMALDKYKEDSK